MHIKRGGHFREEINLLTSTGRPVFSQGTKLYIYLEHGLDVQKSQLPFDGLKAVFELPPTSTLAIPYEKLFYKIAAEIDGKEVVLSNGIITIGE